MTKLILAFLLTFSAVAAEVGEDLKGECTKGVQSSRDLAQSSESSSDTSVDTTSASQR